MTRPDLEELHLSVYKASGTYASQLLESSLYDVSHNMPMYRRIFHIFPSFHKPNHHHRSFQDFCCHVGVHLSFLSRHSLLGSHQTYFHLRLCDHQSSRAFVDQVIIITYRNKLLLPIDRRKTIHDSALEGCSSSFVIASATRRLFFIK